MLYACPYTATCVVSRVRWLYHCRLLLYVDNDEIFKELPVGYHKIHFRFTPTGSSQPLPLTPQEFIIYPTSKCDT